MDNKCMSCQNRYVGCHSECDDYKTYKKNLESEKKLMEKTTYSYQTNKILKYETLYKFRNRRNIRS